MRVVGDENVIKENRIENNSGSDTGVVLTASSEDNLLFLNIFLYNDGQAEDNGTDNAWNNSETGNFWSDFRSNSGYPNYYLIPGSAGSKDYKPMSFLARIMARATGGTVNVLQNYTSINFTSTRNSFQASLSEKNGILGGRVTLSTTATTSDGKTIKASLIVYPTAVVAIDEDSFSFVGTGKLTKTISKKGTKTITERITLDEVTVDGNTTSISVVGKLSGTPIIDVSGMVPSQFITKFDTRIRL